MKKKINFSLYVCFQLWIYILYDMTTGNNAQECIKTVNNMNVKEN